MTRYCHNCTFFEEVSFQQHEDHEEFQISLSLGVQFSDAVAKIYFLPNLQS